MNTFPSCSINIQSELGGVILEAWVRKTCFIKRPDIVSTCEVHESEVQKNIIVLWPFSLHSPMHLTIFFLCSYVGRKALHWRTEKLVPGTTVLARPHYSYWTLGYLISHRGAQKLIDANPFSNLLPVDEYLPIMFNKHPEWVGWCNLRGMGKEDTMYHLSSFSHLLPLPPSLFSCRKDWAAHFQNKNLDVYSAAPLLAYPTHYVGDEGWFSDTGKKEKPPSILAYCKLGAGQGPQMTISPKPSPS